MIKLAMTLVHEGVQNIWSLGATENKHVLIVQVCHIIKILMRENVQSLQHPIIWDFPN